MLQKARQQGKIAGIYVNRDCSFSGRGGIENLAILEDFDLPWSLPDTNLDVPNAFPNKCGLGNQAILQVAFEFQEVLILESWRRAVDCVETLLSICVTVCVSHMC